MEYTSRDELQDKVNYLNDNGYQHYPFQAKFRNFNILCKFSFLSSHNMIKLIFGVI